MSSPEPKAVAAEIAAQLNETSDLARDQIKKIVEICGPQQARAWLQETLAIEANGGMMTNNGQRRRTPGGVYLHIVKHALPMEQRRQISPRWVPYSERRDNRLHDPASPGKIRHMIYSSRRKLGKVEEMRITLIGKPGKIENHADFIVTSMYHEAQDSPLPAGLPTHEAEPAPRKYTVFIARSQWGKVASSVTKGNKLLQVDGVFMRVADFPQKVVFAVGVKARKLKSVNPPPPDDEESLETPAQAEAEQPAEPVTITEQPTPAEQLAELKQQEAELVARFEAIKAAGQSGGFTVMQELSKVRKEIKLLEATV